MRQDQLTKIRQLFISQGGLSADIENSANLLNTYAAQNIEKVRESYMNTDYIILLKV